MRECGINCARDAQVVAMDTPFNWRNTGSFYTELLVSPRDGQSEKKGTIGTSQCLHYPSSYPTASNPAHPFM